MEARSILDEALVEPLFAVAQSLRDVEGKLDLVADGGVDGVRVYAAVG